MAITSPEAITFSNEKVRVAADKLAQLYYWAKVVVDEWNATNNDFNINDTAGGGATLRAEVLTFLS